MPGDAAPPPAPWNSGPYTAPWVYVMDPNKDCAKALQPLAAPRRYQACYVPSMNVIIISRDCDPSGGRIGPVCKALRTHEEGHARGGAHDESGNWYPGSWTFPSNGASNAR